MGVVDGTLDCREVGSDCESEVVVGRAEDDDGAEVKPLGASRCVLGGPLGAGSNAFQLSTLALVA
jgi:hypothetical protein